MNKGKLIAGCVTIAICWPLPNGMAQRLPEVPRRGFLEITEEDAPTPAVPVFEVQAVQLAAPDARAQIAPAAPAPFPDSAPRAVGPDGAFGPPSGEVEVVDRVRVQLTDSSQLVGEIAPSTPLVVKAKFGEVKLTFEDIARIEGAVDDGHWRIALTSGDRITGEAKLTGLKMKTAWGEVQLDETKILALEAGKLHTQQVAVARTSPDGRTRSVAYRQRQIFAPLLPDAGNSHNGYQPMNPYAPSGYPMAPPSAFSAPTTVPATIIRPR